LSASDQTTSGVGQPDPAARVELSMTSEPAQIAAVRRAVESFCNDEGLGDRAACEVGLCVNEALANVIRHAYDKVPGRPIRVTAESDGREVQVRIRDWGNGVNPAELPARPYDPLEPGGLGLICLGRCMDEVRYEPQADGMLLVLRKRAAATDVAERGGGGGGCGRCGADDREKRSGR
jgi:serine/threonine-protein kinase RsbW